MSLINRVALCNYSNALGEDSEKWNPRFRYEVLDFHGQSTVVNLANGGGKTTAANALIGLLARHPTLLSRAKEHAAPRKVGYWSHIQVELIEPLDGGINSDMLTSAGWQVSGEPWVFGMAMSRDGDSNEYYYYQGRLEELAPSIRNQGLLKLTRNEDFRELAKQIKGLEWGVTRESWRSKIGQHIPYETLLGLAEFQIKGGSDKDAPIFKLAQLKKGTRLDEVFFYEILAPELLHDVLDDNESEESSSIDQTLFRIIQNVVNTRHRLAAQKCKVDEMSHVVEHLREAAELGKSALMLSEAYDNSRQERALDIAVINELVSKHPVPGVPRMDLPNDECGNIATHLVVIPGESASRITNHGLSILLGENVRLVKQKADRMHIYGQKSSQVLDIPCDLKLSEGPNHGGVRYQSISYTIKQATDLLRKHAGEDAFSLFEDAVSLFEKLDTNPFRQKLMEAEVDRSEAIDLTNRQRKIIEDLQEESLNLANAREQVMADQAAFDDIRDSGLFTKEECNAPRSTAEKVKGEHNTATSKLADFEKKYARLKDYVSDWEIYNNLFGDVKPAEVHERLSDDEKLASENVLNNQVVIKEIENFISECQKQVNGLTIEISLGEENLKKQQSLKSIGQLILNTLENGESPVGLEKYRRNENIKAKTRLNNCQKLLEKVEFGVQAIVNFQNIIPDIEPAIWISEVNNEREKLTIYQSQLLTKLNNLTRQRTALDVNPVAANTTAQTALDLLDDRGMNYETLHKYITMLNLSKNHERDLLGMFSSLLFSPVINNLDVCLSAAKLFELEELPVPVFFADKFTKFCQEANISEVDKIGRLGLVVGHVTHQVECILDPTLVEKEKKNIDQKIIEINVELSSVADRLEIIKPEGELVKNARVAALAVADGYTTQLEALRLEHTGIIKEVQRWEQLLTDEMIETLRGAEAYYRMGGDKCLCDLMNKLAMDRENFGKAEAQIKIYFDNLQIHRTRVSELNESVTNAYPADTKNIVVRASRFIELDGPDLLANHKTILKKLDKDNQLAAARAEYYLLFERAERWLDYQVKLTTDGNIDIQISKNKTEIELAKTRRKEAEQNINEMELLIHSLREQVEAIDIASIALVGKYKRAMLVGFDYQDNSITEINVDNHPIGKAAWKLRDAIDSDSSTIIDAAESLVRIIDEYNIDAEFAEVKRLYREKNESIKAFVTKTNNISYIEKGLAEVERERLRQIYGIEGAKWVDQFANEYWRLFTKDEDALKVLSEDEKNVNINFAERLAILMGAAKDNLAALQSVASKDPEGMISHFDVRADVASNNEMKEIIDRVVDIVDVNEKRRREDEEKHRTIDKVDKVQNDIRETLYRSVFSKVSVKYANVHIRPDGKAHRLSESLSTGQKNALLMMWVLRLAQYRVEREARKRLTTLSRRRVRNQSQSIMIIDGLFSNLSDPKLINSVMSSLTVTRGHFQMIGLVHDPKYQHNFDLFPVFLMGKSQNDQSWVSFDDIDKTNALAFAKLAKKPAHAIN